MDSCSDLETSQQFIAHDQVNRELFNEESSYSTFVEVPQNQLGVLGIMDDWNVDSALL
jgi:hypothetical protein